MRSEKMRSKGGQLSARFSTYAKSRLSVLQTTIKRKIQRDVKEIAVFRGCEAQSLQTDRQEQQSVGD